MRLIQPIVYRGRLVACVTGARVFLSERLDRSRPGDRELRFVLLMCCYARDVLSGELPGPYDSGRARCYAQAALIPGELLDRESLNVARAARGGSRLMSCGRAGRDRGCTETGASPMRRRSRSCFRAPTGRQRSPRRRQLADIRSEGSFASARTSLPCRPSVAAGSTIRSTRRCRRLAVDAIVAPRRPLSRGSERRRRPAAVRQ
jgi:hypothetical protein